MNRIAPAFIILNLFLFIFMPSTSALAGNATLRVAYTEWFPYTYTEDGQAKGFEIDTLRAVLGRLGYTPILASYPWKRCLANLENGRADLLVSLLKSPERERYTLFPTEHISLSQTVFFTRRDHEAPRVSDLEALRGLRIGTIMGFSYGQAFDQAEYLDKDNAVDTRTLIDKLLAHRDDLAAENLVVVKALARQMGVLGQLRFLSPPIHHQRLYVGFSRTNDLGKLAQDFSRTLAVFKKSREYKAILAQYGLGLEEMTETSPRFH